MAVFASMLITKQGQTLYNKAQAGIPINFTKMKIGSGKLTEGQDQTTLTSLIDYKFDIPISSITQNTQLQLAVISGRINNNNIITGTYICELGLFAQDPDEGEILYAYTNAGDLGDYYAPASRGPFNWAYQINAAVGNAANVTATLVSDSTFDYAVDVSSNFTIIGGINQQEVNESIDKLMNKSILALEESTGYGVISGLTVSAQSTPDMTVNVSGGIVHMTSGIRLAPIGNATLAITVADITNPRVDIIYVNSDSTIGYLAGIPASSPTAPNLPAGAFLLAEINVDANVTTIINSNITDKRKMKVTSDNLTETVKDNTDAISTLNTQELESTGYGVISGLTVSAQSTPDMTVNVASGPIHMPDGKRFTPFANIALAVTTADPSKPRTDIVYVNNNGVISYLASALGTAAVAGSEAYTITTNVVANDTVTINGVTFTAVASGATSNQFNIGADTTATATNLASALNTNTIINADYTASASANIITLAEKTSGGGHTPTTAITTGTIVIANGTVTSSVSAIYPSAPATPDGGVLLAQIAVAANAITITNDNIVDKRKMKVTSEYLDNTIKLHKAEQATQDTLGHVKLATQVEVTTGTEATKVITPATAKVELDKKIDKSLLTTAGDIIYASGANTPARLAKGTDGQALVLSDGVPIWGSAGSKCVSGNYTGDGTNGRIIAVGFNPKLVIVLPSNTSRYGGLGITGASYGVVFRSDFSVLNSADGSRPRPTTNGFIVDSSQLNYSAEIYYYVVIG